MSRTIGALAAFAVACVAAPVAHATFPGKAGRIAYTWSRGGDGFESGPQPRLVGVVSVRPDGGGRRLIAARGQRPSYSPSGRFIAFWRSGRLWVARADGASVHPVSPAGWAIEEYDWSPGGTRLAFTRGFAGGAGGLYTVRRDGGAIRRPVKAEQRIMLSPGAWSPDGRAVVYTQFRVGALPMVRIVRGGRVTDLAQIGSAPTWSPLGRVAYTTLAGPAAPSRVVVVRPGAGGPVDPLATFTGASTSDPVWSPDGRRLMLMYTSALGRAETWTLRTDGTVLTQMTADGFPIFSPDGRRLAASVARFGGTPRLGYQDLSVMRPDGGERRRLVRGGQATAPSWQPLSR